MYDTHKMHKMSFIQRKPNNYGLIDKYIDNNIECSYLGVADDCNDFSLIFVLI